MKDNLKSDSKPLSIPRPIAGTIGPARAGSERPVDGPVSRRAHAAVPAVTMTRAAVIPKASA